MLNDAQQRTVWENWLSAEIRAGYFAELSVGYRARQKTYTIASLIFSSGAFLSLVTTIVPPSLLWIKPTLAFLTAVLSAVTLVSRNESSSLDCADLHFRWNSLAMDYGGLWSNMFTDDAAEKLSQLLKREAEISKSSTSQPAKKRLLTKVQQTVVMQHGAHA